MVLVNSCLSSLPIYTMGFYRLNEESHKKMDNIRAKFFWRGATDKFKYHMVSWGALCRPKNYGGLGILNTRVMNDCLMAKWVWRIKSTNSYLWFNILKAKYFPSGVFREARTLGGSQFWKSVMKVNKLFNLGVRYRVGNGKETSF